MNATASLRLLLVSATGRPVEARLVFDGQRHGPGERHVYRGARPCVELRAPQGRGPHHLGSWTLEGFVLFARGGFAPGGQEAYRIPPQEARRLLAWLENPRRDPGD